MRLPLILSKVPECLQPSPALRGSSGQWEQGQGRDTGANPPTEGGRLGRELGDYSNYTLLLITSNHFVTAVSCSVSLTPEDALAQEQSEVDAPQHFLLHQHSQAEHSYGKPEWEAPRHLPSHPTHAWDHCAFRRRTGGVPISTHLNLVTQIPEHRACPKMKEWLNLSRKFPTDNYPLSST